MSPALVTTPMTLDGLMQRAWAMERESELRYLEFAEIMETHNNAEVAGLFRSIAAHERQHAEQIRVRMGWPGAFAAPAAGDVPDPADLEQAHYLMQPWHVLQLALDAERRAHAFFAALAQECATPQLRAAAEQLQAEEAEHVALLEKWLARVPPPDPGWDDDPDPARYTD